MKIFFSTDLTENKKNTHVDGVIFRTNRVSSSLECALDAAAARGERAAKKANLPIPLRILYYLCGFYCVIMVVALIKTLVDLPVSEVYGNAPFLFWALAVAGPTWGVLELLRRRRIKQTENSAEIAQNEADANALLAQSRETLGVPAQAVAVDILYGTYRRRGKKLRQKNVWVNVEVMAYNESDALCLCDATEKFVIPRSTLRNIRRINKQIAIPNWNKETPLDRLPGVEAKTYMVNQYGMLFCRPYYALCLKHGSEDYEIYFPHYELPVIMRLTGLKVSDK